MMEIEEIVSAALNKFGMENQMQQACEEFAEAIVAINHYRRGKANAGQVADELADVFIMFLQMSVMVGDSRVDAAIKDKLDRLVRLIHGQETISS